MSTRDRLRDHTRQEPESEQEDAHHDEERDVFEPGVVKCKVEKDQRKDCDEQYPESAALRLPPPEDSADDDRYSKERRVIDGSAIEDRGSDRRTKARAI